MAAAVSVGSGGGRRGGLPQSAAMMNLLTDMAFNLLIFFVVLADPSGGRVILNGEPLTMDEMTTKLTTLLKDKKTPEERIVVVDSSAPYGWFVKATAKIEQAGGIVALQLEETKEVTVP